MASSQMHLQIVTPKGVRFEGDAIAIRMNTTMGEIEVLPDHEPLISALDIGVAAVRTPTGEHTFAMNLGYVEVLNNHVELVTETCEEKAEIDAERAETARKRAAERVAAHDGSIDSEHYAQADNALRRAEARLEEAKARKH